MDVYVVESHAHRALCSGGAESLLQDHGGRLLPGQSRGLQVLGQCSNVDSLKVETGRVSDALDRDQQAVQGRPQRRSSLQGASCSFPGEVL